MMKIYIDLVILINFIFDLILLSSVNYILRRNSSILRLVLGSFVGGFTLLLLFIRMNKYYSFTFKIIISFIMVVISFGYKDLKYMVKNITYFYLVSIILGGGLQFLDNQFNYTNDGLVSSNGISNSYFLMIIIGVIVFKFFISLFKDLKNNYSNYYVCKIFFDEFKSIVVNAFLDTGNKLKEPYSNKSIILLDKEKVGDIYLNNPIYVPYNSLNNHGLLECYRGIKIEIDGKSNNNFLIGISNEHFFMDGIDCIINCTIMEGLK